MEISVFSIQASKDNIFKKEINEYIKMSSKFAKLNDYLFYSPKLKDKNKALKIYDEIYTPHFNGYCVVLDERAKNLNSYEFSNIFNNSRINFFIGGAFGLDDKLKSKANQTISLSKMTMSHKLAKLLLFEQIFRALCIKANHPYHK